MSLGWLVAVACPTLFGLRVRSDDQPDHPEAQLARALRGFFQPTPFEPNVDDASIRAVRAVLMGKREALGDLIDSLLLADVQSDPCRLTALTLVACVFLAEEDNIPKCLEILQTAVDSVPATTPTLALCKCLLLLQKLLRLNDTGEPIDIEVAALAELSPVLDGLPDVEFGTTEDPAFQPQDAAACLTEAVRSAMASFTSGDALNIGRDPLMDRLPDDAYGTLREWLDDTYSTKLSHSTPDYYGSDLYFTNFHLELLGHKGVYRLRQELAMMRLVRFMPTIPRSLAADSLRLLRHAGADSKLESLVRELTMGGPTAAVMVDGRRIASYRTSNNSHRTGEMIVLAAAAELMSTAEAYMALQRVLSVIRGGGPTTAPLHWQADSSKAEEAWLAAAALAGAAGASGLVARELLSYSTPERLSDIATDTVIARSIQRIEWESVDQPTKDAWREIELRQAEANRSSPTVDALRSALNINVTIQLGNDAHPLSELAASLNFYLREKAPIPTDLMAIAERSSIESLSGVKARAENRTYARGAIQPAEVIAVLLTQSPSEDLWDHLLAFLADSRISRHDKTRAFDVLSQARPDIAPELLESNAEGLVRVISTADPAEFRRSELEPYPAALRFANSYGLVDAETSASHIRSLAASGTARSRQEAGISLSLLSADSLADWMIPLIYRLSYDSDPNVRVSVASALSRIAEREDATGVIATDRLIELLEGDGVNVPLQALGQLSQDAVALPALNRVLNQLSNDHPSRRIRQRASRLLKAQS